jgi:hypothetical protein
MSRGRILDYTEGSGINYVMEYSGVLKYTELSVN